MGKHISWFVHNTGEAKAAVGVMFFYIGLALGRFVAGLLSKKFPEANY